MSPAIERYSMAHRDECEIVFAGGGAAGCLIAGRLAAANPDLRIQILEAGEHTFQKDAHVQPVRYWSHLAPTSTTVTFNVSKPSEQLGGRAIVTPSGRAVGGGSSVNFTMYTRAAASDYDDWEKFGNPGWGFKDLLPLLKKTEMYQIKPNEETHGYSGPVKVSYGGAYTNVGEDYLETALEYDKKRSRTEDINNLADVDVYGRWQKWIDDQTGRRSDVPHHIIYNQARNQNLQITTGVRVKRVIFEGDRAVGVEYVKDTTLDKTADQTVRSVYASRLVVVSAGAFGSPTILERSGIGSEQVLSGLSIDIKVDLAGVGENYCDHNVVFAPYLASNEAETLDDIFRGDQEVDDRWVKVWKKTGRGLIAHNGFDSGAKIRPTIEDMKALGPAFAERWTSYLKSAPDKPVLWLGSGSGFLGNHLTAPARKFLTSGYYIEYPASTGSVHIQSATDANAPHEFDSGFLTNAADLPLLRWGYKISREIARRMRLYRGEFEPYHPKFADDSLAACREQPGPVPVDSPDIPYTEEEDQIIDEYNRNFVQTAWHSLGTCAMKPRQWGGVVDSRLNVYGVQCLKVADLSIAPANVSANTYSSALVVGEKAAIIIAQDLGLKI